MGLLDWQQINESAQRLDSSQAESIVTLFYDGGCPLCRREISYYQGLDQRKRVSWLDIDADPAHLAPHGVSKDQAMALIHALDAQGRIQVGVPAFLAVWEQLPYWRVLPPLLRSVPAAIPVANACYRFFARHRLQLTQRARHLEEGSACLRK